jgi:GNAT superfamily N-acetyltransferase
MAHETRHAGYLISDDPTLLDVDAIHSYLARSYWVQNIPREIVAQSVANSLCIGLYAADGAQVGLVRVVTDYTTFGWLCDVFVLEPHRGRGLSKAALRLVLSHPRLQTVRRLLLATRDAHGLYAQVGFTPLPVPSTHMELRRITGYPPAGG